MGRENGATLVESADPRLSIEAEFDERLTRLVLTGPIDFSTSEHLGQTLGGVLREGSGLVVVDLRGVTDLDPSGLRVLISAEDEARGRGRRLLLRGDYMLRLRVALGDYAERYRS